MRIKKQLTDRAYRRFKSMCTTCLILLTVAYFSDQTLDSFKSYISTDQEQYSGLFVNADQLFEEESAHRDLAAQAALTMVEGSSTKDCSTGWAIGGNCTYNSANGYVNVTDGNRVCDSFVMIPGSYLINTPALAVFVLLTLGWLFMGIGIISDIFMEAIEEITAQTKTVELWDRDGKNKVFIDVPIWNPTVANLTLMALGSSAPEILLSVIGTVQDIEGLPSKLGPSTIVGSAAFNLLIISGVSIIAVGTKDEPDIKKVYDTGVFAVTSIASLFAYIWLYLTLKEFDSPEVVEMWEAWLTLAFFFILIAMAFGADKLNAWQQDKKKTLADKEDQEKMNILAGNKQALRMLERQHGKQTLIEIAQGKTPSGKSDVNESKQAEIKRLYRQILNTNDLGGCTIDELAQALEHDSLLERFAYRKQNGMAGNRRDFMKLKGSKGQVEHEQEEVAAPNEIIGFKCLNYSVTESNGSVEITIIKKTQNMDYTFGYRTVDDTAKHPKDYAKTEDIITMKKRDTEVKIHIPIVDDEEWNPDLDFFVELFDPHSIDENQVPKRLEGDDTKCKVTILDEDFPGVIGFESTDIRVSKNSEIAKIKVTRTEGSDGTISCMLKTEPLSENPSANNAEEYEDYIPQHSKVTFLHQETEKTIEIKILKDKNDENPDKLPDGKDDDGKSSEGEATEVLFKVKLEKPDPQEVKISKKNCCMVTIVKGDDENIDQDENQKLLEYYLAQRDVTYSTQFRNAVALGPQIDQDNMVVEEVTAYDAFCHFCSIFWKIAFATVPPPSYWGGKAAFIVSLCYIGVVTAVVGAFAELLGCLLGIDDSITAITLVALGTSLPDTFASMTAARTSEYADAAIGNITGSNSVNVFLGLGLPWVIATMYFNSNMKDSDTGETLPYRVPAGEVAYSVFVFLVVAIICFIILIGRRLTVGGELGGPYVSKYISCVVLICLWTVYIVMSIINAAQGPVAAATTTNAAAST